MTKNLSAGARKLPLRHIYIRVPWNATDWSGVICKKPGENISCLVLPRIHSSRKDALETNLSGKTFQDLKQEDLPPCVSEHGQFMAPYELTRIVQHPYAESS